MQSMKVGVVLCLMVSLSLAFWKVPLQKTNVKLEGDTFVHDEVHYASVELGKGDNGKKVKASFDSTILFNWYLDSETKILKDNAVSTIRNTYYECKPPCQFDVLDGVFRTFKTLDNQNVPSLMVNGDRFKFTADSSSNIIGRNSTNKMEFHHKEFDGLKFLVPNVVQELDRKLQFNESEVASLGLGRPDYVVLKQNNFADALNKTVQIPQIGFSFYIHNTLSQIIFGEAENFFAKSHPLTRIRNLGRSRLWESRIIKMVVNKVLVVGSDSPRDCKETNFDAAGNPEVTYNFPTSLDCSPTSIDQGRANPAVIFDTTTRHIYGPEVQLSKLFLKIREHNAENVITAYTPTPGSTTELPHLGFYVAVCTESTYKTKFPPIDIYFYEHLDKPFTILPEDYLRYDATIGKCWLLFRNNEEIINADPKQKFNWYLGTSFLSNNYCHFNQVDNSVNCAPAFKFTPGNKHINDTARIAALVTGALILLAALGLLISLFTKVPPFQPSSAPVPVNNSRSTALPRTVIESHTPAPLAQSQPNNIYNSRFPPNNSGYNQTNSGYYR